MCLRKALCESKLKKTFSLFPAVHSSAYMIPRALRGISALGNSISALPGAQRGSFAPGKRIIVILGAQRGFSAPGNPVFALPGALRGFSAPGNLIFALLGANGYCFAPGRRKPRRQKVFFLNWGVRPVGEGLGKAQPQQDPLATDPVPAGAGSEDGSRAGPSPIGKRERQRKQELTGKREYASETKHDLSDRQTKLFFCFCGRENAEGLRRCPG